MDAISTRRPSRRTFLGAAGVGAAALALTDCSRVLRFLQSAPAPSVEVAGRKHAVDVFSICDNCVNKCGLRARVVDGRLVKLNPNPENPKSRDMLCARGNAAIQQVYDPDRLKQPLIRAGARGEGKWRTASWDEALDYTAKNLAEVKEKHGPQGTLFSSSEGFQEVFFKNLGMAFGSAQHRAPPEHSAWPR